MYTDASQFPHFAGMSHDQRVMVGRRAFKKHPIYTAVAEVRHGIVLGLTLLAGWLTVKFTGMSVEMALVIFPVVGIGLFAIENLLWVNTVLYRVTRDEVQAMSPATEQQA